MVHSEKRLTWNTVKLIAVTCMFLDHARKAVYFQEFILKALYGVRKSRCLSNRLQAIL